jgi:AcrR family transcriptional regulator
MEPVNGFPVSELAARTGVRVPTIHAYLRRGLLPAPERVADNRFLYDRRHVEALGLIRLLRERRHLPLDTIEEVLPTLLAADRDHQHAFRPEMWEQVLRTYLPDDGAASTATRLAATARTIFCRCGYAETSIDEICVAAGIAKGSFYRYFASKDDVYVAAAASVADAVIEQLVGRDAPVAVEAAVDDLVRTLEPFAPLLLEAASRALHGEPGHAGVVPGVMTRLADHVAGRIRTPTPSAAEAGRRAVGAALSFVLRDSLGVHLGLEAPSSGAGPLTKLRKPHIQR